MVFLLLPAVFWLAACEPPPPSNQNANLRANQNINPNLAQSAPLAPTPLPTVAVETTPTPAFAIANSTPARDSFNANTNINVNTNIKITVVSPGKMIIPVEGVRPEELTDTFNAARSEGRRHDAIDVMAACGVPVIATADGEVARFFDSVRGGITIYQYSSDKKMIYYYAHLQKRADGLQEKSFVRQGTLLGYVGDTGNSGAGNCHLHFAVWHVADPKRYWDGENLNPYPLLR